MFTYVYEFLEANSNLQFYTLLVGYSDVKTNTSKIQLFPKIIKQVCVDCVYVYDIYLHSVIVLICHNDSSLAVASDPSRTIELTRPRTQRAKLMVEGTTRLEYLEMVRQNVSILTCSCYIYTCINILVMTSQRFVHVKGQRQKEMSSRHFTTFQHKVC